MTLAMVALGMALAPAPGWTIVKNGKSDFKIVVAPGGSPSMEHGAREIQTFLKAMSGATLEVVKPEAGWSDPGGHVIVVADDAVLARREKRKALGDEEFRIQTNRSGLLVSGGAKRGAMYGCYALLEDVLGVRWYSSRVTKVPRRATVAVPSLDRRGKPAFEYREPFFTEAFDKDWAARNRANGNAMALDASVGGKVSYGRFVHTFNELVPPETYFDAHPEYFSMIDGQRKKGYYQLCLTNKDVAKITIAKVEDWIRENPDATIFSVSQNDTYANCQCPDCQSVEKEENAPSGPLLRFVNTVAAAVGAKHPDVLIDTLAYQWSEKPPSKTRPRKNVRIRIAPIYACFSHPLDGCTENAAPYKNLLDWAKITNQIYIWHYTTNFANYLQPLPNLDEITGDVRLFKKNGVVGFFDEGGYAAGGGSEMAGLKSYLLAKLMWDPNRDAKVVIDDYVNGVYGKAAVFMSQWIGLIHKSGRAGQAHAKIYDPPTAPYLPDALLVEGAALFDQAEAAVMGDPQALDEVQRTRLSLEYVQLARLAADDPKRSVLAKKVGEKIHKYGITQIREGEPVKAYLDRIGQP